MDNTTDIGQIISDWMSIFDAIPGWAWVVIVVVFLGWVFE